MCVSKVFGSTYIPGCTGGIAFPAGKRRWYIKMTYRSPDCFRILASGIPQNARALAKPDFKVIVRFTA